MKRKKCVVIDYGIGNVFSVLRVIEKIGHMGELTSDPKKILRADRVILPGVGSFGQASLKISELNLDATIVEYIASGKPFLGICVGMQLLVDHGSEFGFNSGLGVISGSVKKINLRQEGGMDFPLPLIGWRPVKQTYPGSWENTPMMHLDAEDAFYFLHSYSVEVENPADEIGFYEVGESKLTSIIKRDNVLGVQFHPERSAASGQNFLKNFIEGISLKVN
ncbi:MAG: imidazole glycerol phosphate synthase subunit HisH [Pseudomonadota bacterium]|nr:imidazole glycerol phosphate synthase subunit HisH [Pseudomonadota bacterium]